MLESLKLIFGGKLIKEPFSNICLIKIKFKVPSFFACWPFILGVFTNNWSFLHVEISSSLCLFRSVVQIRMFESKTQSEARSFLFWQWQDPQYDNEFITQDKVTNWERNGFWWTLRWWIWSLTLLEPKIHSYFGKIIFSFQFSISFIN